ncbi:hypothetical protein PG993_005931 [Apiospora rasikravindrae]|uniref:Uncharacterized protein n=1 Tax=Apiospora rasikravindrae TaxID=990691 RepID=A0ABR1TA71_9PEZI
MSDKSGESDKPIQGNQGETPKDPNNPDEPIDMNEDLMLVLAIFEEKHPEFDVKDWDDLAAQRGMTNDDAQQRFAAIVDSYKSSTRGKTPAKPVIKRRNRGGKRSAGTTRKNKDENESDGDGDNIPSGDTAHPAAPTPEPEEENMENEEDQD